jgi:hypothetical protein
LAFSLTTNFIGDEKRADILVAEFARDTEIKELSLMFLIRDYAWHLVATDPIKGCCCESEKGKPPNKAMDRIPTSAGPER